MKDCHTATARPCLILVMGLALLYWSATARAEQAPHTPAPRLAAPGDSLPHTRHLYIVEHRDDGSIELIPRRVHDHMNEQWLAQQAGHTRVRHGTAALGYLLREGIKSVYGDRIGGVRIVTDDEPPATLPSRDRGGMEYKLRLRDDELKLGMEYNF